VDVVSLDVDGQMEDLLSYKLMNAQGRVVKRAEFMECKLGDEIGMVVNRL
jgi:hypothetical protein